MRPAGATVDRNVLIPGRNTKIETVDVTPVELVRKLLLLQKRCWLVVEVVFFLSMFVPRYTVFPVPGSTYSEG